MVIEKIMDNRQCIGLDKFHQCLSTLFPSNNDNVEDGGDGGVDGVDGSEIGDCGGVKRAKTAQESSDAGTAHPDRDPISTGTDRDRPRRHNSSAISVRFTKTAVELLRESLNAYLRRVGRDLLEELDAGDPMSQHPIRPEDVIKVLLALDGDNETTTTADTATSMDEEDVSNGERTNTTAPTTNSNTAISHGEMKELVSQAQDLLLQRKRLKRQQNQELKQLSKRKISIEPNNDDDPAGGGSCTKESIGGSACGMDHESNNSNKNTKSLAAAAARTTTSAQQQPKKKKRKRKKQKLIITAEMEAEQDRLLNASKKAFDLSRQQQQQNGGGDGSNDAPAFRVELS